MNSVPNEASAPRKVTRYRHITIEQYQAKAEARFWAKVEKTEFCWLWEGHASDNGYGIYTFTEYSPGRLNPAAKRTELRAHRYSWSLLNGPIPDGIEIDHMCHTRLCVRPDHLRMATRKQNGENRSGATSRSRSGVRGVHWVEAKSRWRAVVGHNGKNVHVGLFRELGDAEAAVKAKRNELYTHNIADRLK